MIELGLRVVENNATDINNNSIVNIQSVAANNPNENGNSNAANAALQQMQLMLNQMTQLSQPSVENMTQGQIIKAVSIRTVFLYIGTYGEKQNKLNLT